MSETFYQNLKEFIALRVDKPMSPVRVISLIAHGIKFSGQFSDLTDDDIRTNVTMAIKDVVSTIDGLTDQERSEILYVVDLLGSEFVQTLIEFARDTVTFLKTKVCKCFRRPRRHQSTFQRAQQGVLGETTKEFHQLKEYMNLEIQKPFTAGKVAVLIASGVKFIENYESLSGIEKKNLVIHAMREVISSTTRLDEDEKKEFLQIIDNFSSDFIDYLVLFGRNTKILKKKCVSSCK